MDCSLLNIPSEVFAASVLTFLPLESVSRLDLACLSRRSHTRLLELLENTVVDNANPVRISQNVADWLRSRKVSLTNFSLYSYPKKGRYTDLMCAVTMLDIHRVDSWQDEVSDLVHSAPQLNRLTINAVGFDGCMPTSALWKPSITEIVIRNHTKYGPFRDCIDVFHDAVDYLPSLSRISYLKCSDGTDCVDCIPYIDIAIEDGRIVSVTNHDTYRLDSDDLSELLEAGEYAGRGYMREPVKTARVALREVLAKDALSVKDHNAILLAQRHPNLRVLILGSHHLKDETLYALAEHCPLLEVLYMGNGEFFTDAGVVRLAQGCANLRELTLNWDEWQEFCLHGLRGPLLTDASAVALSINCPKLEKLDLTRCQLITDAAVQALARGCPGMTSLSLNNCPLITDAAIAALAQGCRGLQTLHVAGCLLLTDAALLALSEHCPQLRALTVTATLDTGSEGISEKGLRAVKQTLSDLEETQWRYCLKCKRCSRTGC